LYSIPLGDVVLPGKVDRRQKDIPRNAWEVNNIPDSDWKARKNGKGHVDSSSARWAGKSRERSQLGDPRGRGLGTRESCSPDRGRGMDENLATKLIKRSP